MRFLHIADLHIGKVLHKRSLLNDQEYILKQIIQIAEEQKVDAVLIAGDIYQRNTPPPEAMTMFSNFITELAKRRICCYIISGNHDSAQRVSYFSSLAELADIHIAGTEAVVYDYETEDEYGLLTVHLLSYCTPSEVRLKYPEEAEKIHTYEDAVRTVLSHHSFNNEGRHIIVCHQFITGAKVCDSEELAIGGLDNISAALFDRFDYAALGHLHGPQYVSREAIRYAGSPLKYSFSELNQKKSVTIVDVLEKGNIRINTVLLKPLHEMREYTGTLEELLQYEPVEDYVHIILTDEETAADANRQLRTVFPNMLLLTVRNSKMRDDLSVNTEIRPEQIDFLTMFSEFYSFQNAGAVPNERQQKIVSKLLEQIDGEEKSI